MKFSIDNNVLTLFWEGRIDSVNAAERGDEACSIIAENPHDNVVIDAESLEYISSAGLRVVLKIRKTESELKVVNASLDVYEIFNMTGFTEMMSIEKAYRKLSIEGCEVIGQGANGKVYRLDGDTIIKVYMNPDSLEDIHRERELARKAFVLGLPTAISYDVVKVGESYGSVFELLDAKSFAKLIASEPENLERYVKIYVELLKKIHSTKLKKGELPEKKQVILGRIKKMDDILTPEQYEKINRLVEEIPDGCGMIHGDYHIKNVLMQNGEATLIDMDTLSMGDPIFEFAAMYLAYVGYGATNHSVISDFLGIPFENAGRIWKKSLEYYFETDDADIIEEKENKIALFSCVYMYERIVRRKYDSTEQGRNDAEFCRKQISELIGKVENFKL